MKFLKLLSCLFAFLMLGCGGSDDAAGAVTIRYNTDSIGAMLSYERAMAEQFEAETGIAVELVIGPDSATERLAEYQRFLRARSEDIDVYKVDVIWPKTLSPHLIDLSGVVPVAEIFDTMIENNTVDGSLVAVPYYGDAPLLFYRTDLLEKYGLTPPETWDELTETAQTIMEGERAAGNDAFFGYVFQGAAYEGLTCNALEWQASNGGGEILTADGQPDLATEAAQEALNRAKQWIGAIAPRGVLTYREEESRAIFAAGNAAFMRNWPYAYSASSGEDSPVDGKIGAAPLPAGASGRAGTLGGWGLAVSQYSNHPEEAKKWIAYLSSASAQKRRALEASVLPTVRSLYDDEEIATEIPYFPIMEEVMANTVARPSNAAGRVYNEISAAYYQAVHDVLSGASNAEEALPSAEQRIIEIMNR